MGDVVRLVTRQDVINQEAIKLLERVLEEARSGAVVEVAVATVYRTGAFSTGHTPTDDAARMLGACTRLVHRLCKRCDEREAEGGDPVS